MMADADAAAASPPPPPPPPGGFQMPAFLAPLEGCLPPPPAELLTLCRHLARCRASGEAPAELRHPNQRGLPRVALHDLEVGCGGVEEPA